MVVADHHFLVGMDHAPLHTADGNAADKLIVVDGADQHLQRAIFIVLRRVDILDDRLKKGRKVGALLMGRVGGNAAAGRAENRGRIELFLGRVQIEKELEHLVNDLVHPGVGRSILLTTTMTLCPSSSAFWRTKRVWGMGPSAASTSSSTPSTIFKIRSTSPEKSACPGVSTILIL